MDTVQKEKIFAELILFLETSIKQANADLEAEVEKNKNSASIGREPALRTFVSDNTENLRTLKAGSISMLRFLRIEDKSFQKGRETSSRKFLMILAKVPHPLPPEATLSGEVFVLAKNYPPYENLKAGGIWSETLTRGDELATQARILEVL